MTWDSKIPAAEKKFYRVTRFRPDTCGCVLTYAWDIRTSEDDRKHIPADIEHACEAHAHHIQKGKAVAAHHHQVMGENQLKNKALAGLLEEIDGAHVMVEPADNKGNSHRRFRRDPRWHFDDKRDLVIELDDVTAKDRTALLTKLKKHCGDRKVHLK